LRKIKIDFYFFVRFCIFYFVEAILGAFKGQSRFIFFERVARGRFRFWIFARFRPFWGHLKAKTIFCGRGGKIIFFEKMRKK